MCCGTCCPLVTRRSKQMETESSLYT
jgi:hypothetical protein